MRSLWRAWASTVAATWLLLAILGAVAVAQPHCPHGYCAGDAERPGLRVGYTQFAPYSSTSSTGLAEGYSIDLIRMLLEPRGYHLTFVPYGNPGEMIDALVAGKIDVTSLLGFNPERERLGLFTAEVHAFTMNIFVQRGGPEIREPDDLLGLRVGVTRKAQGDRLITAIEGLEIMREARSDHLLMPLLSGAVDAVVSPGASMWAMARQAGLSTRIEAAELVLHNSPAGLMVRKGEAKLLADINLAIGNARATGQVARLHKHWFAAGSAPITDRESLAAILAGGAVAGALAFWAWLYYRVLRRARKSQIWADLLSDALDATGASVMVADPDMRPIWWNALHAQNNPGLVHLLRSGASMEVLISTALQHGGASIQLPQEEAEAEARKRVEALRAGAVQKTLNLTPDGRVLKRRARRLASGHYAVVTTDVTALSRALDELKSSSQLLEEANVQLQNFSNVAAHDLAAPLRNLRNLHQWIREDISDQGVEVSDDMIENFTMVDRLLERQSALIQDLLDYARNDHATTKQAFDPGQRFASVLDLCSVPEGFTVTLPGAPPRVFADPVAFDIVLRNLISNAAKHHDRDAGTIAVGAEVRGGDCVFTVTDDGPGIPERFLATVFQPFKTIKSRDDGAGTGLGLSFVQRTVKEWGGTIEASRATEDRGTRFTFTIPLAAETLGDQEIVDELRRA